MAYTVRVNDVNSLMLEPERFVFKESLDIPEKKRTKCENPARQKEFEKAMQWKEGPAADV